MVAEGDCQPRGNGVWDWVCTRNVRYAAMLESWALSNKMDQSNLLIGIVPQGLNGNRKTNIHLNCYFLLSSVFSDFFFFVNTAENSQKVEFVEGR